MNLPIFNAINKYLKDGIVPFHMPGHKLGNLIPKEITEKLLKLDLTEVFGLDNLYYPTGAIKESLELAQIAFTAQKTYFLVNGSSGGIHSMIMTITKPGDKIIVNRDCHKSVINGMILAGVEPVYINAEYVENFGVAGAISIDKLRSVIEQNRDAKAILLTRPNYYGICSDINEIIKIAHENNIIVAIDEAHGSHLNFHDKLPESAVHAKADICVQSAHKNLPSLTGTAYLHVNGDRIDMGKLEFNLRMLHTTSPSYLFMVFLDLAREIMQNDGEKLLENILNRIDEFEHKINSLNNIFLLKQSDLKLGQLDRTKLLINVERTSKTGYEVEKILREEYNIQVEMSDLYNILCIVTVAEGIDSLNRLFEALYNIDISINKVSLKVNKYNKEIELPKKLLTIRDSYLKDGAKKYLKDVSGRVSKDIITPYPPGVPIICPGEVFTEEIIEYIISIKKAGGHINGLDENDMVEVADYE